MSLCPETLFLRIPLFSGEEREQIQNIASDLLDIKLKKTLQQAFLKKRQGQLKQELKNAITRAPDTAKEKKINPKKKTLFGEVRHDSNGFGDSLKPGVSLKPILFSKHLVAVASAINLCVVLFGEDEKLEALGL